MRKLWRSYENFILLKQLNTRKIWSRLSATRYLGYNKLYFSVVTCDTRSLTIWLGKLLRCDWLGVVACKCRNRFAQLVHMQVTFNLRIFFIIAWKTMPYVTRSHDRDRWRPWRGRWWICGLFYSTLRGLIDAFVKIFLLQLRKQKSSAKMYLGHIFGTHLLLQILKFSDVCSMSIFNKVMDGCVTALEYACNRFLLS